MLGSPSLFQPDPNTNAGAAVRSFSGMAHFAGTGPQFETCQRCQFWVRHPEKTKAKGHVCREFRRLTKGWGDFVPPGASACKYFALAKNVKQL